MRGTNETEGDETMRRASQRSATHKARQAALMIKKKGARPSALTYPAQLARFGVGTPPSCDRKLSARHLKS